MSVAASERTLFSLGDVPERWSRVKVKHVAHLNPPRSESMHELKHDPIVTFLPMAAVGTQGQLRGTLERAASLPPTLSYFRRGDVLMAKITPCFQNAKGGHLVRLPTAVGFGSTEFVVLRPGSAVRGGFLRQFLASHEFTSRGRPLATGTAGQQRVPADFFANFELPLPPLEEQDLILRFLDHLELRVALSVAAQRRLIELLDERRRTISHHLVLGAAASTGSGMMSPPIEWLPDVPAHWGVRPAKWFYREVNERSERGAEQLLSVSHLTGVTLRSAKNVMMFMAASYAGHKLCRSGDLVINTMWAWMGALGVADEIGIVSPAYGVYRPLPESPLQPQYANLLLRSRPYIDEYTCRSTGIRSSRLRLYPDRFLTVPILCPPEDEQRSIVARVTDATHDLDEVIAAALREIEHLQEYRTRLIADVVSGRRDVRAEAAELPGIDPDELAAVLDAGAGGDDVEDDEE